MKAPSSNQWAPHKQLFQRYALLFSIVLLSILFAHKGYFYLCLILIPFLYLIDISTPYSQLNTRKEIDSIINSLPVHEQEPANWFSQLLSLIWPHLFPQHRVDSFKEKLQWVLDNNPVPYFTSIVLNSLEIGDIAPQITQVSVPTQPLPSKDSFLFEVKAIYYPSFLLNALIALKSVPAFNITFKDLTLMLDVYVQLEFTPDPYLPNIPFWTSMDMSLATPPQLSGFNVTLFSSSSNLINKESIKNNMSQTFSNLLWQFYGMPKGFVWERVTGVWMNANVCGSHVLERCSVSDAHLIRYSRVKKGALDLCKSLYLPEPLTLQTIEYKDKSTSTKHLQLLEEFKKNITLPKIAEVADAFNADHPSADELELFVDLSYDVFMKTFSKFSVTSLKRGKSKSVDENIAYAYVYMNFLSLQKKVNWEVAEKLDLEKKVKTLEQTILKFHNKMSKKS
ncbi:hypothetical protein GPJ56_004693 [Histomonas meleagridis]|uniref:uncharacterized protein n=1 Tax=Histomonas meleagridis TaxID=135588 RepID=UPI00355A13AE|nr:hypothetical protein GPJ56_004693 [Histomonas meleagridis]KAH0803614.1 hypothetical protein GO595_003579 [Histomonas meleagridis]